MYTVIYVYILYYQFCNVIAIIYCCLLQYTNSFKKINMCPVL